MTDDEQDFESRKYSHRLLLIGLLDSGNIAIADSKRNLLEIIRFPEAGNEADTYRTFVAIIDHLAEEYRKPLPEYEPPQSVLDNLPNIDDLDLRI